MMRYDPRDGWWSTNQDKIATNNFFHFRASPAILFIVIYMILTSKAFATNMDCEIESYEKYHKRSGFGCGVDPQFSVTEPGVIITTVNGDSISYYHNRNITNLQFHTLIMHYFPRGIEKLLPQLEWLDVIATELKIITQADLKPFPNLKRICLQLNHLERLDSDLFEFNLELQDVNLSFNRKLKTIGKDIFRPLTKLSEVSCQQCNCFDFYTSGGSEIKALSVEFEKTCESPSEPSTFDKIKSWFSRSRRQISPHPFPIFLPHIPSLHPLPEKFNHQPQMPTIHQPPNTHLVKNPLHPITQPLYHISHPIHPIHHEQMSK